MLSKCVQLTLKADNSHIFWQNLLKRPSNNHAEALTTNLWKLRTNPPMSHDCLGVVNDSGPIVAIIVIT